MATFIHLQIASGSFFVATAEFSSFHQKVETFWPEVSNVFPHWLFMGMFANPIESFRIVMIFICTLIFTDDRGLAN